MRMAIMAMIMRVTMMIMRMATMMIMIVVMIMRMIVATATSRTMSMLVTVIMIVMTVIMAMAVMIMGMLIMTMLTMRVIMIGAALGLEGARHGRHRASQATDHFGEHMIFFDIDRIRCDLGWCMTIAYMPSGFQKPHRILGFDFDQRLRRGAHENKRAILELNRITIIQRRGLFKIEQKRRTLLACERNASAVPPFMIKAHLINNFIGFDGGFAHNRNGPLHKIIPFHYHQLRPEA